MGKAWLLGSRGGGLLSRFCHYGHSLVQEASEPGDTKQYLTKCFCHVPGISISLSHASHNLILRADLPDRRYHHCYTDKKSRAQRGQVICPRVPSCQGDSS